MEKKKKLFRATFVNFECSSTFSWAIPQQLDNLSPIDSVVYWIQTDRQANNTKRFNQFKEAFFFDYSIF